MLEARESKVERTPTEEGGDGGVRGGRHLWMMDERWEGLQTVRCSLYLSCLFDTEIEAKLDEGKK